MGKEALSDIGEQPRGVTRGCNSQQHFSAVGIHWFRGSFPHEAFDAYLAYLLRLFGEADGRPFGIWGYDQSHRFGNGVTVYVHSSEERYGFTGGRFAIEVPGSAIEALEPAAFLDFVRTSVTDFGVRPSRLDIYYDDQERTITPCDLLASIREVGPDGRLTKRDWCGPQHVDPRIESDLFRVTSASVNFGRRGNRGSGAYLRCYDKDLESNGENKAVRWELELSDEKARTAVDTLLLALRQGLDAVARLIGRYIAGSIDFRYRSEKPGEKNLARLRRYEFWQRMVAKLSGPLRFTGRVVGKTIRRAREYVERQLVPTLQMLREALGSGEFWSWFGQQLDQCGRLKTQHRQAIREYRAAVALAALGPDGWVV